MNKTKTIIYAPSLNLFAFNLARGLDGKLQTKTSHANWLKDKYSQIMSHFPDFEREANPNFLLFFRPDLPEKLMVTGKQIQDTDALILSLYRPQKEGKDEIEIEKLEKFNPNDCLNINANLGKTLLFHAFIDPEHIDNLPHLKKIATSCLNSFLPQEKQPAFSHHDRLFNSHVFVYGHPKKDNNQSYQQILVLFFTKEENKENFIKVYRSNLAFLLLDFHKIVTAYHLGKQQYDLAVKEFDFIAQLLEDLQNKYELSKNPESQDLTKEEIKAENDNIYDVIIVGDGFAGLSAAMYFRDCNINNMCYIKLFTSCDCFIHHHWW